MITSFSVNNMYLLPDNAISGSFTAIVILLQVCSSVINYIWRLTARSSLMKCHAMLLYNYLPSVYNRFEKSYDALTLYYHNVPSSSDAACLFS